MIEKINRYLNGKLRVLQAKAELIKVKQSSEKIVASQFDKENWTRSLINPTDFYIDTVRFFYSEFPQNLRKHRLYFSQRGRGFGEDAFHVLWWMLFTEIKPTKFLEIGVYRGQVLSLASLLQQSLGIDGDVTGISPFLPAGDTVSRYRDDIDYQKDTLINFRHFGLPEPLLIKAFSTNEIATKTIISEVWDAIYIDGNHDYEVARSDWEICSKHVRVGGVIVLDDSALYTEYKPPTFATGGHPGPSQLANELDSNQFQEILRVGHNRVFQRIS